MTITGGSGTCSPSAVAAGSNLTCAIYNLTAPANAGTYMQKTPVKISYTDSRSGITHSLTGFVQGKIEASTGSTPTPTPTPPPTPCTYSTDAPSVDALWHADDGSGPTAADSSGNGRNAALINSPAWQSGASCKKSACLQFNGLGQYSSAGGFSNLGAPNRPYTIEAWVKPASANAQNIVHVSQNANGWGGWCLPFLTMSATGRFVSNSWNNALVSVTSPSAATPGTWYHLATTWDAGNGLRLFVNGAVVASTLQRDA
ncbi:LamG domain-containing protein [Candidatus Micrarchaeota archaeon]|nr:LamG domain-containing protein [Candidatus Micrarchaeota archaeon]